MASGQTVTKNCGVLRFGLLGQTAHLMCIIQIATLTPKAVRLFNHAVIYCILKVVDREFVLRLASVAYSIMVVCCCFQGVEVQQARQLGPDVSYLFDCLALHQAALSNF